METVPTLSPASGTTPADDNLADDVLRGAEAIAAFLYGSSSVKMRRKVYYLAEKSKIPIFRLGSMLCARRTVFLKWIAEQEQRCLREVSGEIPSDLDQAR
jgi:hypothetical protein